MKSNEIMEEARRLHKLGFAIHWLRPKSKVPVESKWTTGPRKSWEYLKSTFKEGYNVGVRTGEASKINNGFLAVVDVDVKSEDKRHRGEALKAARKIIQSLGSEFIPTVLSGRGGGSRHIYYLTREPFKTATPFRSDTLVKVSMPSKKPSKKELEQLTKKEIANGVRLSPAWEVSLYSAGRQVVLPPSIHPDSGKTYKWSRVLKYTHELPFIGVEKFLEGGAGNAGSERDDANSKAPEREALKATERSEVAALNFEVCDVDLGWLPISDEIRAGIIDGDGIEDRSRFLLRASSALVSVGLTQNEVLTVLTDPKTFLGAIGYDHAKTSNRKRAAQWVYNYTLKKVERERSAVEAFKDAEKIEEPKTLNKEEAEEQAADFLSDRDWRQDLDRGQNKKPKDSLKNLNLILSNSIEGPLFKRDEFANRIAYGAKAPWGKKKDDYLQDIDVTLIKHWMGTGEFNMEPSKESLYEVTDLIAHHQRVHPVKEWLNSLKWDGVKRIDTWLKDYCEAEAKEPYLSEVGRKFLLAMVKRVFEPGCQWDYTLVLEGDQGKYKSSIARALASDKWFMDNLPDLRDKDAMLNLQGKWLIELGELTNVKRSDFNLVKQYLVRRIDRVRAHYGRIMSDVPRQSVFIGTVNDGHYLKDPTGNRRFWPVKVGHCDVKALTKVREQLFAEAMHIHQTKGEVLMLGPVATAQAIEAQEDRRIDDDNSMMKQAFEEFVNSPSGEEFNFDRFQIKDLFVGTNAPWGQWANKTNYAYQIAAQVLHSLGFEKRMIHGFRIWRRIESETENPNPVRVSKARAKEIEEDFH